MGVQDPPEALKKGIKMGKGRSGKTTTTKKIDLGTAIQILNMSDDEMYCTFTGRLLPKRGFAWKYKDMLFINRAAALSYENQNNPELNDELSS